MNFTHYILTRYNVGLYSDNPYNIDNPDEWMEERFFNFRNTFESVVNQNGDAGYAWDIYYDDNTPHHFISALIVVYGRNNGWIRFIPWSMRKVIAHEDYILTTRLDNDDILEPDFVETVQAQFCEREGVIDVEGRQFDTATGKYYTVDRRYPNSPFITLVEKGANPKTVFHKTHTDLHKDYKWSAYVKGKPLYTQVIHGNNLANKITGREM